MPKEPAGILGGAHSVEAYAAFLGVEPEEFEEAEEPVQLRLDLEEAADERQPAAA